MKTLYGGLCIVGTVLPLMSFVPWLSVHGLNAPLMVQQIAASPLSAFCLAGCAGVGLGCDCLCVA